MKKLETKITRYQYGEYYVDIVSPAFCQGYPAIEAWLSRKDIGVAELMFGVDPKDEAEFLEMVECNIEDYIEIYEENLERNERAFEEEYFG